MSVTSPSTHPIFGPNRLKLGIFAANASGGGTMTTAPEGYALDWQRNLELFQSADRLGFELLIPLARWRGFGGPLDFNGESFESYTWAAGIAQATQAIACVATSHVYTVHPILAAKQATTIDHISGGRFALNIVCGWYTAEMAMFGAEVLPHDLRYDFAGEWIECVKQLWTSEEEFDFDGRWFHIHNGYQQPKPLHAPHPPLINAGGSPRGQQFAARYCDVAFITVDADDLAESARQVAAYRELAKSEYDRDIQVWSIAYVIQRDTRDEALAFRDYYAITHGDDVACDNFMADLGVQSQMYNAEQFERLKFHLKAGFFGYPLLGPASAIADDLLKLSQIGLDGILLVACDYYDELDRWGKHVTPLLIESGLREALESKT